MKRLSAGIIGCGTIGRVIAEAIVNKFADAIKLSGVCDIDEKKALELVDTVKTGAAVHKLEELIKASDLVIEAASGSVSYEIAKKAVEAGKDVMVMSTGGLLGKPDIFGIAAGKGAKVYLPSGAVCGLDGAKSAMMANVKEVVLTTRKPPKGLTGAPFIKEKKIDLDSLQEETVIFDGTAEEAVKGFPKNVNVSATLSFCTLGPAKTRVRIVTSPDFTSNSHEIEIKGDFGRLKAVTENAPMPGNPKTSYLAGLSAVATLKNIVRGSVVGN